MSSPEYEGLQKFSEWELKKFRQVAQEEHKAFLLTSATALAGLIVSCVVAINTEGNVDMVAKTAAAVSTLTSACTLIMAVQAGELAQSASDELSSRKTNS